ncbi:MAG: hypothetical protein V4635_14520 [Bacteroidota bacterium]
MRLRQIALLILSCLILSDIQAQEKSTGPKEKSLKSERKMRKELRFAAAEKRRKERAERKAVKKYHKRLQTKTVRKRMKASKKSAIRYNENKREFFIKRWFKKRKRV